MAKGCSDKLRRLKESGKSPWAEKKWEKRSCDVSREAQKKLRKKCTGKKCERNPKKPPKTAEKTRSPEIIYKLGSFDKSVESFRSFFNAGFSSVMVMDGHGNSIISELKPKNLAIKNESVHIKQDFVDALRKGLSNNPKKDYPFFFSWFLSRNLFAYEIKDIENANNNINKKNKGDAWTNSVDKTTVFKVIESIKSTGDKKNVFEVVKILSSRYPFKYFSKTNNNPLQKRFIEKFRDIIPYVPIVESSYSPSKTNKVPAIGLFQITQSTLTESHESFTKKSKFTPPVVLERPIKPGEIASPNLTESPIEWLKHWIPGIDSDAEKQQDAEFEEHYSKLQQYQKSKKEREEYDRSPEGAGYVLQKELDVNGSNINDDNIKKLLKDPKKNTLIALRAFEKLAHLVDKSLQTNGLYIKETSNDEYIDVWVALVVTGHNSGIGNARKIIKRMGEKKNQYPNLSLLDLMHQSTLDLVFKTNSIGKEVFTFYPRILAARQVHQQEH